MASDSGDDLDSDIETGTVEYWRARARQWEKRCRRAEREKTQLISELNRLRERSPRQPGHAAERRAAAFRGDVYPGVGKPPTVR
jgi:hypothetical protein